MRLTLLRALPIAALASLAPVAAQAESQAESFGVPPAGVLAPPASASSLYDNRNSMTGQPIAPAAATHSYRPAPPAPPARAKAPNRKRLARPTLALEYRYRAAPQSAVTSQVTAAGLPDLTPAADPASVGSVPSAPALAAPAPQVASAQGSAPAGYAPQVASAQGSAPPAPQGETPCYLQRGLFTAPRHCAR